MFPANLCHCSFLIFLTDLIQFLSFFFFKKFCVVCSVGSDISRVFLGRMVHTLNPWRCNHGWHLAEKCSKFVPPDTLKIHSLPLSVLRFLCKTFSILLKLSLWKTLFCGWFFKNSYIQIKICMTITLWELQTNLSLKDRASSTAGITWSSVDYLCKRKNEYLHDLLLS